MSELAVRSAIKSLIVDNQNTLVTGLTFQGQPKSIHQVTYSALTPPNGYYFVSISVSDVDAEVRNGFGRTTSMPPSEGRYVVIIDISDYAISTFGEDQMYEKMDADFQIFSDRVVALLRSAYWITDTTTGSKFRLPDKKLVSKSNLSDIWTDAANYHALLYCRITFQLLEECTDDSVLY